MRVHRIWLVGVSLLIAGVYPAFAQEVGGTLGEAQVDFSTLLQSGQRIDVVSEDGEVVSGRVISVSETRLVLDTDDREVGLATGEVVEITRYGDPLWDGALGGAGGGALGGLLLVLVFSSALTESDDVANIPRAIGWLTLNGALVGAGVGLVIDALRQGKTNVFSREARPVAIVPILTKDRKGLAVAWRF